MSKFDLYVAGISAIAASKKSEEYRNSLKYFYEMIEVFKSEAQGLGYLFHNKINKDNKTVYVVTKEDFSYESEIESNVYEKVLFHMGII